MRQARSRWPWLVWAIAMLLLVAAMTMAVLNGSFSEDPGFVPVALTMVLGYLTVGAVVASRNPRNPIGWLMLTIGVAFVLPGVSSEVVDYARRNPGEVPWVPFAAWVGIWSWPLMFGALALLTALFPDGRVPSRRWRFLPRAILALTGVRVLGQLLDPGLIPDTSVRNPTGVEALRAVAEPVEGIGWLGLIGATFAAIVALFLRYRRAAGEERQQIRWLAYVAAAIAALALIAIVGGLVLGSAFRDSAASTFLFLAVITLIGIGVPVAIGIAVLRYRLWDLDLVLKKAVVFGVLVVFLTAVFLFLAVVLGATFALTGLTESPGYAIGEAFLLGALLVPLWRLSRKIADKVVFGGRSSPYEVLTEFSGHMAQAYRADDVLPRMAAVVGQGAGAERVWVSLLIGGEMRPVATWPERAGADAAGSQLFEVLHLGELLGEIGVAMPPNDPMNPSKERLIRDLASQAGLVLRNVRLIEELRESRRRIVAAQDEERRRIERNIHDGAQQQLVALSVKLGLADSAIDRDASRAHELLAQLQRESNDALENLRDLARGIYPPLLADERLVAALEAQASKAPIPISIEAHDVGRFQQEVEATVYFCVLEALTNVAKYAGASSAEVALSASNGILTFEVDDDGVGFDPAAPASRGTGLQGMVDRADALGGTLEVRSAPGSGTAVVGRIPAERIG
jgi:signal transduction histidine kinase